MLVYATSVSPGSTIVKCSGDAEAGGALAPRVMYAMVSATAAAMDTRAAAIQTRDGREVPVAAATGAIGLVARMAGSLRMYRTTDMSGRRWVRSLINVRSMSCRSAGGVNAGSAFQFGSPRTMAAMVS